jgi:hypothetical protein
MQSQARTSNTCNGYTHLHTHTRCCHRIANGYTYSHFSCFLRSQRSWCAHGH